MNDPTASSTGSDVGFTPAWLERHRLAGPPVAPDDIVGLAHVRRAIDAVILAMGDPAGAAELGLTLSPAVLLHGDPGTGKSLTARHLATALPGVPAYELPPEELTPARLRGTLALLAATPGRSLVLLEEVESFGIPRDDARHTPESRALLYSALGALERLSPGSGPLVVATSNEAPSQLDPGLVRAGRLATWIAFESPSTDGEREALFRHFLGPDRVTRVSDEGITHLARSSRGLTPADIEAAVADAASLSVSRALELGIDLATQRELVATGRPVGPDLDDLLVAVSRRSGILPEHERRDPATARRIAAHEAGHVVAGASLRGADWVYSVRTGPRSGETRYGTDGTWLERMADDELCDTLVGLAAGTIAERLVLGSASLLGEADVLLATSLAIRRLEAGLEAGLAVSIDALGRQAPERLLAERATAVTTLLGTARTVAERLLTDQIGALRAIAELIDIEGDLGGAILSEQIAEAGVQIGGDVVDEWRAWYARHTARAAGREGGG